MSCTICKGAGFVESWNKSGGAWIASIQQCRLYCNIAGYSIEVQKRLSTATPFHRRPIAENNSATPHPTLAKVLPFRQRGVESGTRKD